MINGSRIAPSGSKRKTDLQQGRIKLQFEGLRERGGDSLSNATRIWRLGLGWGRIGLDGVSQPKWVWVGLICGRLLTRIVATYA